MRRASGSSGVLGNIYIYAHESSAAVVKKVYNQPFDSDIEGDVFKKLPNPIACQGGCLIETVGETNTNNTRFVVNLWATEQETK